MAAGVSVIIPSYNRAALLRKAIESVLTQSYDDFELIVVDSSSDNETPSLLQSFGESVTVLRQERKGPSAARNFGIENSSTEFIAFLDSDDWWHKDKLTLQLEAMEHNPSFLISHTQEVWYSQGRVLRQRGKHRKYHGFIFEHCLPLCAGSPSTVIARREFFSRVGMFDESFITCEDYDLWLRASIAHPFLLVDKALTFKDGGREDQMSRIHRVGMDRYRIQALLKILSPPCVLSQEQEHLARQELERKCRIYGAGCIKHGKIEEGNYYLSLTL